jgi:hypothetical protein
MNVPHLYTIEWGNMFQIGSDIDIVLLYIYWSKPR